MSFKKLKEEFEFYSGMECLFQNAPNHPNYGLVKRKFESIKKQLFEIEKNKAEELMKVHDRKIAERWKFLHMRAKNFGI